jgi:L-seryl-tRNA(Ser) seleniumtransferase
VDKTTLAGLQATLRHYLLGEATDKVPVWRMISQDEASLQKRARTWVRKLRGLGVQASVLAGHSTVGGGSLPGETLPTRLVALDAASPDAVAAHLRSGELPVISRIEDDRLVLDPRTVLPEQEPALWQMVAKAIQTTTQEG